MCVCMHVYKLVHAKMKNVAKKSGAHRNQMEYFALRRSSLLGTYYFYASMDNVRAKVGRLPADKNNSPDQNVHWHECVIL